MGRITCANVTSDLFAMGVRQIDNVNVLIKFSTLMSSTEQEIIGKLLLQGFAAGASEANIAIKNVTAVENPWCTIGGIATAILPTGDFILPINAVAGDLLVLTKPLGTQIACAAHTPSRWERLKETTTRQVIAALREQATLSMARLNLVAAKLMHVYSAHASTDVTGFGILGHANNLAQYQKENVKFIIDRLPFMENAVAIAKTLGMAKLLAGTSPETSGGLFIALPAENAQAFCQDIFEQEGCTAWIIGKVVEGERTAEIVKDAEIIEVPMQVSKTMNNVYLVSGDAGS